MLLSMNNIAAVVTDNDSSGFVTKAEFEAFKKSVQHQVDLYNENIDTAIDGAIATYLAVSNVGGVQGEVLDKVFPIGYVLIASEPPQLGTWVEITDTTGRALYLGKSGTNWGQKEEQKMPNFPTMALEKVSHTHTFEGTPGTTNVAGNHNHSWQGIQDAVLGNKPAGAAASAYLSGGSVTVTASHSPHSHNFTPSGTITSVSHKHTISHDAANDPVYKNGNTKVQPDAFVIRMWKRTA